MIQHAAAAKAGPAPDRKPVLLVVDDDDALRKLLNIALQRQGFDVWLAASGEEAVDISRHQSEINLALLDIQMTGMDGTQTLAALREARPDLPCCFMTGDSGFYRLEDLLNSGAACVFPKPLDLPYVARMLREILRTSSERARPAA